MKYLVLKQLGIERKSKTNDSKLLQQNDAESVTAARHFQSNHAKKTRRFRSAFTTEQIKYLEKEFKKFPYIGSGNRKEVSSVLNIPERAVKIWFQNRRMKEKKDVTNKEIVEEQKNVNIVRQGQPHIKPLHHQPHSTQPYTVCQSKLKTIYPDPSITIASIKHFSGNKNLPCQESKSIENKQKMRMKNLNNRDFTETSNSRVNKVAPVVSRQLNNKVPMKVLQNKNIRITKLAHQLPLNPNLEPGKVKQENPKDLTSETQRVIPPNYYQITPNHDQRYVPLHVQALPQPPFVPGNILWKPVNVMSVLPGIATSPPQVHNNNFSLMHSNFLKDDCNCNCYSYNTSQEMSPLMQIDGIHLQSQYILAMPLNFDRI